MAARLNVALTGASGFVGSYILARLLTGGHKVRVLIRQPAHFSPKIADAKLHVVPGSLFDDRALSQLVQGVDAVIHIVGIIRQIPGAGQTFERIHVESTQRLIRTAKQAGIKRWVHMSALGSRPDAVSAYHATKWQAETCVRESGLDFTIFRPSIIHGPDGEFMQMVKGFWCNLMPPFVPYFSAGPFGTGGAGRLQPIWVQDVARCFVESLANINTMGETYPMGGPSTYRWPQLYQVCARHLPKARQKKILAVPVWKANLIARLPGAPFNHDQVIMSQEDSVCDIGKVQSDFGFKLAAFDSTFSQYATQIQ